MGTSQDYLRLKWEKSHSSLASLLFLCLYHFSLFWQRCYCFLCPFLGVRFCAIRWGIHFHTFIWPHRAWFFFVQHYIDYYFRSYQFYFVVRAGVISLVCHDGHIKIRRLTVSSFIYNLSFSFEWYVVVRINQFAIPFYFNTIFYFLLSQDTNLIRSKEDLLLAILYQSKCNLQWNIAENKAKVQRYNAAFCTDCSLQVLFAILFQMFLTQIHKPYHVFLCFHSFPQDLCNQCKESKKHSNTQHDVHAQQAGQINTLP